MQTLTKVYQKSVNVDSGDCFGACLASLTGIPIETIPLFRGDTWIKDCGGWLFERGFQLTQYPKHRVDRGYHVVGKDPFFIRGIGWRCHAVVYKHGEEAHNPLSDRSAEEITAANNADGITDDDILRRMSGIVFTIVVRSINA